MEMLHLFFVYNFYILKNVNKNILRYNNISINDNIPMLESIIWTNSALGRAVSALLINIATAYSACTVKAWQIKKEGLQSHKCFYYSTHSVFQFRYTTLSP
jgi:hypothetical protein